MAIPRHRPYLDRADLILPLRLEPGSPDRDQQALAIVQRALPHWAGYFASEVTVDVMSGGITNLLLRLTSWKGEVVLVRAYGPETERVIDRERENRLFARLSSEGFAPPYLARFDNGRVEGFLEGVRPLEPHEMGEERWRRPIGRRLAELHAFPIEQPESRTFTTLRGWLTEAARCFFGGAAAARHQALRLPERLADLDVLVAFFGTSLQPDPAYTSAVRPVLAHNDLLSGNILVNEQTDQVRFIDYEYGDTGFAAFDLANHFCEYAGFDSNFEAGFPSEAVRHDVIAAYGIPEQAIEAFDRAVRFFVLVDHLWWGSWAVIQACHSPIDFDFMAYAEARMAGLAFHTRRWGPTGAGRP